MRQADIEIARIVAWLRRKKRTAHVSISGKITLRDKATGHVKAIL
jgi:hypothetical protein